MDRKRASRAELADATGASCGSAATTEMDHLRADRYRVEPFGRRDWATARNMLLRGYSVVPASVWDAAFARLSAVAPGPPDDALGVLLHGPQGVCGVSLLIGSYRGEGAARRVNASSWAISPEARSRALWMCRAAMPDDGTVYTALTPIPSAQRMLQRVGFKPISHQRVRVFAPRLATSVPHRHAFQVAEGERAVRRVNDPALARALEDHLRLGCLVYAVGIDGKWSAVVMVKRRRLNVVPVAEVIYCGDQGRLLRQLPALGAPLLRRGIPFVEFEAHEDLDIELPCNRVCRRRFARGPYAHAGIDHLYSELVYVLR